MANLHPAMKLDDSNGISDLPHMSDRTGRRSFFDEVVIAVIRDDRLKLRRRQAERCKPFGDAAEQAFVELGNSRCPPRVGDASTSQGPGTGQPSGSGGGRSLHRRWRTEGLRRRLERPRGDSRRHARHQPAPQWPRRGQASRRRGRGTRGTLRIAPVRPGRIDRRARRRLSPPEDPPCGAPNPQVPPSGTGISCWPE